MYVCMYSHCKLLEASQIKEFLNLSMIAQKQQDGKCYYDDNVVSFRSYKTRHCSP